MACGPPQCGVYLSVPVRNEAFQPAPSNGPAAIAEYAPTTRRFAWRGCHMNDPGCPCWLLRAVYEGF